jgi:hypothetical protein
MGWERDNKTNIKLTRYLPNYCKNFVIVLMKRLVKSIHSVDIHVSFIYRYSAQNSTCLRKIN